jgi:hypothetical protein
MQQIADWLQKLGLGQYADRFAENDIDFIVLADLTDQDLKKIGVASLGHRRKLLRAIAKLKDAPEGETAAAAPVAPRDTAEHRQVTVMFSDLVGSTALSARMDPEDPRLHLRHLTPVRWRLIDPLRRRALQRSDHLLYRRTTVSTHLRSNQSPEPAESANRPPAAGPAHDPDGLLGHGLPDRISQARTVPRAFLSASRCPMAASSRWRR